MWRWCPAGRSRFRPSSGQSVKRWSPPVPKAARCSCSSCLHREPARGADRVRTRATVSEPSAPVARVAPKGGALRFVLFFFVALTASAALPGTAISADTLRVCADPDNLPFSRAEGPDRGLYVELAELVAGRLGLRSGCARLP